MKTCATLLATCAALAAFTPARAVAQFDRSFFVGGGLTLPTGDYDTYAMPGWIGLTGVSLSPAGSRVWFGVEGYYGHNEHDDFPGDATNLYGGDAFVGYDFGDGSKPYPYVFGSGGLMVHAYSPANREGYDSPSAKKFAVGGGAGLAIPAGGGEVRIEARIMAAGDTQLIPLLVGYMFRL